MADLTLNHIYKVYPNGVQAVSDFNLEIKNNEFIVFVGPSGCGKSTTLRMIAGLEEITSGELFIGNNLVNSLDPKDRDIAFVFQNYALYPHMTVYENMAFGLKSMKIAVEGGYLLDKKRESDAKIKECKLKIAELKKKAHSNKGIAALKGEIKSEEEAFKQIKAEWQESAKLRLAKLKKKVEEDVAKLKADDTLTKQQKRAKLYEIKDKYGEDVLAIKLEGNTSEKRKLTPKEINKRILTAAETLQITEYLKRKPKEMSGGQRQRVALGRALVRSPKVFLLDEPLSNLDAKLRNQMRTEITKLHQKVKTTFIYVTHDQTEAMTMGDRIVVMKDGFIQQIDEPMNLYNKPVNKFVAGFIGTPQMNFIEAHLFKNKQTVTAVSKENIRFDIPYEKIATIDKKYLEAERPVIIGFRPESVVEHPKGIPFLVNVVERLGNETLLYGDLGKNETLQIVLKVPTSDRWKTGMNINIAFDMDAIHIFDKESEISLLPDVPESYELDSVIKKGKINIFGKDIELPKPLVDKLEEGVKYRFKLPSDALIPDGELRVRSVEVDENVNKIVDDGLDYFFKVEHAPSYSILFDKVSVYKGEELVIKAIPDRIEFLGRMTRNIPEAYKGSDYTFFLEMFKTSVPCPFKPLSKAAMIDGKACHRTDYIFQSENKDIKIEEDGPISLVAIKTLDYGVNKYVEAHDLLGNSFFIPADKEIPEGNEFRISIDLDNLHLLKKDSRIILL